MPCQNQKGISNEFFQILYPNLAAKNCPKNKAPQTHLDSGPIHMAKFDQVALLQLL